MQATNKPNDNTISPGGVVQATKVTLATSTATMPMAGMAILYACFDVNPAVTCTG